MTYETLKRTHLKRNILIAVVVVAIISAIILNFTQAKYRTTQSMPLIQGTINFSPSDLNLMAVYLNKNGETISSDKVPHVGYTLNTEQSICEVNDVEDETIEIVYENGLLNFNGLGNKGTKCTAYFDLIPDSEKPVINGINSSSDDTSITITVDATDNIGIYYYYYKLDNEEEIRVEKNSYTFEGLEKDSVHTITVRVEDAAGNVASDNKKVTVGYRAGDVILAVSPTQGETTDWTGGTTYYYTGKPNNWVTFAGFYWRIIRINGDGSIRMIYQGTSANETGTGTQIGTSKFNSSYNHNRYVGYMYGSSNSDYNSTHTNTNPSTIEKADIYTIDEFEHGNGALTYPIGLISADEAMFAGIPWSGSNSNNYLYTGQTYWTMSPSSYSGSSARVFSVFSSGDLFGDGVVNNSDGVRPVINLKSAIAISGSGTTGDPFKVG